MITRPSALIKITAPPTNKKPTRYNHYPRNVETINSQRKARQSKLPSRVWSSEASGAPKWKTSWRAKSTKINSGIAIMFISEGILRERTKTNMNLNMKQAAPVEMNSTAILISPIPIQESEAARRDRKWRGELTEELQEEEEADLKGYNTKNLKNKTNSLTHRIKNKGKRRRKRRKYIKKYLISPVMFLLSTKR